MKNILFSRFFTGLLLAGIPLAFTACEKTPEVPPGGEYAKGVFVVNEGNFGLPNGAVSFYDPATGTAEPNVFEKVNNRPLGDVVQSMTDHLDRSYIVVNNSNKIEVVEAASFRSVGVIEGLSQPRYLVATGDKAFVTEWVTWGAPGRVAVVDLKTNTVTKTLPVGEQPEQMLLAHNGKLYVANAGGNTLSVIDPATETVEGTIPVGDGPNSLVQDANHNLWVLAGGREAYNADYTIDYAQTTAGRLLRFNPASPLDQQGFVFTSNQRRPAQLQTNREGTQLYFLLLNRESGTGKLYDMSTTASALPQTNLVAPDFYGLGVDPSDNVIYGADPGNFSTRGQVFRYSPTGEPLGSFQADIGPNGFVFR